MSGERVTRFSRLERRSIMRAFWIVVLVAFLVTCFGTFEAIQAGRAARSAQHASESNRKLIRRVDAQSATIQQLEASQRASCTNFNVMKLAVNDFHGVFLDLLTRAQKRNAVVIKKGGPGAAAARVAQKDIEVILAKTHKVKAVCAQRIPPHSKPGKQNAH